MITRHVIKSCCGSRVISFETDKPIRKFQLQPFRDQGYLIPEHFTNAGQFYVQKGWLIATATFGATRISVRCNGENCPELMDAFSSTLEEAINIGVVAAK